MQELVFDGQFHPFDPEDARTIATLLMSLSDGWETMVHHHGQGSARPAEGWWIPDGLTASVHGNEMFVVGNDPHVIPDVTNAHSFHLLVWPHLNAEYRVEPDCSRVSLVCNTVRTDFVFVARAGQDGRIVKHQRWTGRSGMGPDVVIEKVEPDMGLIFLRRVPTDLEHPNQATDETTFRSNYRLK